MRWAVFVMGAAISAGAATPTPEQVEFFEKRVRPVLVSRCYACHSSATASPMGGLRVDSLEGLLKGGKRGPAVSPGNPDASPLAQAVRFTGALKMPPSGKLPDGQIADLTEWIRMGAPVPSTPASRRAGLWSLQPVRDPAVPSATRKDWVRSPVDAFVLAALQAKGLEPAPPADKPTLLRRVTYDLTGLPPTPAELVEFVSDASPDAFRRVVDRLLASPRYGERWGRHWLDLVRYAETNGHEFDNDKLAPWRYRDYVIRAFNDDVPYDQFVREHIAGDLLPRKRITRDGAFEESPLGTSFYWFGEILNSATDSVKSRADQVDNQIDVLGKTFLGLTVACARCHDHKFDPIPTVDYYALAGVLHSTELREAVIDSPERTARIGELSRQLRALRAGEPQNSVFANWRISGAAFGNGAVNGSASSLAAGSVRFVGTMTSPRFRTADKLYLHVRYSGTKSDPALKERGPLRLTLVADGYKGQHVTPDGSTLPRWKTLKLVLERNRTCYFEIVDHSRDGYIAIHDIVFSDSPEPPSPDAAVEREIPESAFAMLAADYEPHNVQVHLRGNHNTLGAEAPRGVLRTIAGDGAPKVVSGSGRMELAEWVASAANPLTARVMVNRIWKHHFGKGIVRTPDNFGAMGETPTHPELLDYLAARFVENGWSVKSMHRLMLLSSTYQMSSRVPEQAASVDPENKLLSHAPVQRLEAEAIRDAILAVSGSLKTDMFGPSVPPHISAFQDGRGKPESGPLDGDGRRSIYIQLRRNFLPPMLLAFDYPPPVSAIGSRSVSTVPAQALLLLNNEFVADQAGKWAARTAGLKAAERVGRMIREAFAREADAGEAAAIVDFVNQRGGSESAWADVAHVLLNSPEFLYVR